MLDLAVEALGLRVRNLVMNEVQKPLDMPFQHPGLFCYWLQAAPDRPFIPLFKELFRTFTGYEAPE